MLRIPIPNSSYAEQTVTLNGQSYGFTFRYNSRAKRWKLDISDSFENVIVNGLTLIENSAITPHITLPTDFGGELVCVKLEAGDDRLGRLNVGVNKTHELVYIGDNEI